MKRHLLILLVLALLGGALAGPADAAKKKKKKPKPRTISATYDSPAVGVGGVGGACLGTNGCVEFGTAQNEAFVSVESADSSGQPVFLRVGQDDASGNFSGIASYCGESTEPIPISPGLPVQVFIYPVGISPPCPGPATTGSVTATFTAVP